jgi:serine/threonine protein kinase
MPKSLVPPGVEPPATERFLKSVVRSGLLTHEQLEETLRSLPGREQYDSTSMAEYLIRNGKLTRFQAVKLMQGAVIGLILGPYQVLSAIGKGGMGRVYLARDQRTQQLVALKVLPPKMARAKERLLMRFLREMSISQMLSHPHLAQAYETGNHQGIYYIAMEFIPGQNLAKLINREGSLSIRRAARLFGEVCLGLDHAHGQGLIHRDLKPSNIMITPNDHAKVLDLGLAIMEGEGPSDRKVVGGQGYVVGTMDYLAPEQAEDAINVDSRADLYSLGCTLYYTLTGRAPFAGGTSMQKIKRHCTEEPTMASQLNPNIPPAFEAILIKMMAKRPEARYASATEVREALLPWASGETVLPLDQRNDAAVVAELEKIETISDSDSEDVVVGTVPPNGQLSSINLPPSPPLPPPAPSAWMDKLKLNPPLGILALVLLLMLLLLLMK